MSLTLTVTGVTSELITSFFPPILLPGGNWHIALLNFETFNSIPNIPNSHIIIGSKTFAIPRGSYEIADLERFINKTITPANIKIKPNLITHQTTIRCSSDFTLSSELARILGFSKESFQRETEYSSDKVVNIFPLSIIQVDVNIARGSYINGKESHSVHAFFPSVASGFRINETPHNLIYHPITTSTIDTLEVRIVDQDNKLINFLGDSITARFHLKQLQ